MPRREVFWLARAKERWLRGKIEEARNTLRGASAANPDSEAVWLAAAKLERATGEVERAAVLYRHARERAPSGRVYMKAVILKHEQHRPHDALQLIHEGPIVNRSADARNRKGLEKRAEGY